MSNRSAPLAGLVAGALIAILAACTVAVPTFDDPPAAPATLSTAQRAAAGPGAYVTLAGLRSADPDLTPRYDREAQFGDGWADLDEDGCDTRDQLLAHQPGVTTGPDGCAAGGTITEPYSGAVVSPLSRVDVDHVVSLGDAWRTGAQDLTARRRLELANDPTNLIATSARLNRQKGDDDASQWLPPDPRARCAYVARQIKVKARYLLAVTGPERAAMVAVLSGCPDERLPLD